MKNPFLLALGLSFSVTLIVLLAFAWSASYEICRDAGHDWIACAIVAVAL